jgi:hypothetical protein
MVRWIVVMEQKFNVKQQISKTKRQADALAARRRDWP